MKLSSILSTSAIAVISFALSGKAAEVEWIGIFDLTDVTPPVYWYMQQKDGSYADPSMRLVFYTVDSDDESLMEDFEMDAESLIDGNSCVVVNDGGTITPSDATCVQLTVDQAEATSQFQFQTTGIDYLLIYAEHNPVEFEENLHYMVDGDSTNVFPSHETGEPHSHDDDEDEDDETDDDADDDEVEDSGLCFSGNMEVVVQGKGPVAMEALQVGDYVKIGNDEVYERVYAFAHRVSQRLTEFVQIHTNAGTPLEMTGEHLVFKEGHTTPVRADSVKVGDLLQAENGNTAVEKVSFVTRNGVYNPLTSSGTIQVNGITASNYISFQKENEEFVELQGGIEIPLSHHGFAHLVMAPFRFYCTNIAICDLNDENAGMPSYVSTGIEMVGWRKQQHIAVQLLVWASILMLILSLIVLTCAVVLQSLYLVSGSSIPHLQCLVSQTSMIGFNSKDDMKKEN